MTQPGNIRGTGMVRSRGSAIAGFLVLANLSGLCALANLGTPMFRVPLPSFSNEDLIGTWHLEYAPTRIDELTIGVDGQYIQTYFEGDPPTYEYISEPHHWILEPHEDGIIRLLLEGGHYYSAGSDFFITDGRDVIPPFVYYDPFSRTLIQMEDQLALTVVLLRNGELALNQMWTSSDRGFPILGGSREYFTRVATPAP